MQSTPFEKNIGLMGLAILIVVSLGGLAQIVPLFFETEVTAPSRRAAAAGCARAKAATCTSATAATSATRKWCARSGPRPSATATMPWPANS